MASQVNMDKFVAMIKAKRVDRGLRAVADEIGGISASTLSRVERGDIPDLDTFIRLCRWLGVSTEEFLGSQTDVKKRSTPEVIEAHLRADRTLNPKTAEALARLVRETYELLKKGK